MRWTSCAQMKNSYERDTEKELLQLLSKDDRSAYRQLYGNYLSPLYRYILPFANHDSLEAEGIVQDVFVKIWENRNKLAHIQSFESYLFRMAKNLLIELHRQWQARHSMKSNLDSNRQSISAHEQLVFEEYYESAQTIIEELSPQRKRIFLMRTQTEMSIDEIARVLNISQSAVKKQLYEAIRMVKSRLNNEHDWPLMWWIVCVVIPVLV